MQPQAETIFGDVVAIFAELYARKDLMATLDKPELAEMLAGIVLSHFINERDEWDYTQSEMDMVMKSWRQFLDALGVKDTGDLESLDEVMSLEQGG